MAAVVRAEVEMVVVTEEEMAVAETAAVAKAAAREEEAKEAEAMAAEAMEEVVTAAGTVAVVPAVVRAVVASYVCHNRYSLYLNHRY